MLALGEINVSRARLARILSACLRPSSTVLRFYQPVGLVHHREHCFLDVVDDEGRIQGSVAAGEGWTGAMIWTNLHEIRRALRKSDDAFVCLRIGHERLLVDGTAISYSDPLKGLDTLRDGTTDLVEFETSREPVLVVGIGESPDMDCHDEVPRPALGSPGAGGGPQGVQSKPVR